MAQTYFPFDSGLGANVQENQWSKMAQHWLGTGVIRGLLNELQVYADSTGMQVKAKTGQAWIKGHFYESDVEEVLAISTADATNPRIDRVIIRLDWTENSVQLAVLQGVPAVSPVAPALTQNSSRWEISLAQVQVDAAVTTIASGKISNERYFVKNANAQQETTFKVPLLNGTLEDGGRGVQVFKDELGLVHIWINVAYTADTVVSMKIAVLPEGYRPEFTITDSMTGSTSDLANIRHGNVTIHTNGEIIIGAPIGGGWRYLHKGITPYKGV